MIRGGSEKQKGWSRGIWQVGESLGEGLIGEREIKKGKKKTPNKSTMQGNGENS